MLDDSLQIELIHLYLFFNIYQREKNMAMSFFFQYCAALLHAYWVLHAVEHVCNHSFNIITHNELQTINVLHIQALLLFHGSLSGPKLLGIHINSEVFAIFVLIFLSHISPAALPVLFSSIVLLADTWQDFRAGQSLGQQRLLCIMMWFLDELFHNLCNERMSCCLIYVMSEWGLFVSVYWAGLDLSMWTAEIMLISGYDMNHISSFKTTRQQKITQNTCLCIFNP